MEYGRKKGDIMKKIKIANVLLIVLIFFVLSSINVVYAAQKNINPDSFNPSKATIASDEKEIITEKTGKIIGLLRNISIVIFVLALMVIGVKYIIGSVEQKARYKETLIPLIIGVAMVTMAVTIVSFVYDAVT